MLAIEMAMLLSCASSLPTNLHIDDAVAICCAI